MADPQTKTYTNADLARMAKGTKVRVFEVDKKTKEKSVVEREVTADDVLGHGVRGNKVTIVTVDGQKIEAVA